MKTKVLDILDVNVCVCAGEVFVTLIVAQKDMKWPRSIFFKGTGRGNEMLLSTSEFIIPV